MNRLCPRAKTTVCLSGEGAAFALLLVLALLLLLPLLALLLFLLHLHFHFHVDHAVRRDGGVLGQVHAEADHAVVVEELDRRDGQVLRVVGRAEDRRELGGHLRVVPQGGAAALHGIDDPPPLAGRRLEFVPEAVAVLQPLRAHRGAEDHLADLGGRPACSEIVVGRDCRRP
jgi:hypothetical protein